MITEDYVSFEVAKLLKEKGFNVETEHKMWYVVKPYSTGTQFNSITYGVGETTREYSKEHCIPMPTQQMVLKWLRDVHGILISVSTYTNYDGETKHYWSDYGSHIISLSKHDLLCDVRNEADTYEEAVEEALKYCLENLI